MNTRKVGTIILRFLAIVIIIGVYLSPWHRVRYFFAKEWFMPRVVHLQTDHFKKMTAGGYGSGVGFKLHSKEMGTVATYRYKASGGWFMLLPLIIGIITGIKNRYGIGLVLFHIIISFVNALLFYLGAAFSNFLLAIVDLNCYYLVPALSLALIPYLMMQRTSENIKVQIC